MAEKWICKQRIFKDTWIRKLHGDKFMQISDGTIPGLYLRYSRLTNNVSFYLGCVLKASKKRKNIFLGKLSDYETVEDVKRKACAIKRQIIDGALPNETTPENIKQQILNEEQRHPFLDTFNLYMEKYSKLYKKPRTQKSNWDQLRLYLKPIFGQMYLDEIEESHVLDAYTVWVKQTSFSTANKALSLMSSFWTWCESYKYVPRKSNPCLYVRKGSNEKYKPQILDETGYKAFFKALEEGPVKGKSHPKIFRAIKVLALTGCRCKEITDLLIDEVALEEKMIHLHDSKTGARDVKLCDAVIPVLEMSIKEAKVLNSKYVFPSILNPNQSLQDIRKAFNWVLKEANLPHMRIHDLRHSFITIGANTGQNMIAMRDAAGHSRISTTEGYSHISDKATFIAVNNVATAIYG